MMTEQMIIAVISPCLAMHRSLVATLTAVSAADRKISPWEWMTEWTSILDSSSSFSTLFLGTLISHFLDSGR
jgi:hypothetical protein